jgi:predicted permease
VSNLPDLLAVLAPIYLCVAAGYFWARAGRGFDLAFVTAFAYVLGAPSLVFSAIHRAPLEAGAVAGMAGAALLALVACAALAAGGLALARQSLAGVAPLTLPCAGAMGLSIARDAFGADGLALGAAFLAVALLAQATLGRAAAAGRWDAATLVGSPVAWAVLAALALAALPWTPPRWALNTTWLLGGTVVPVALIAQGVVLARAPWRAAMPALSIAVGRIGIGLVAGIAVTAVLGLNGPTRAIVILETAMPVALLWANYRARAAAADGAWGETAASIVLGLVVLPALVVWLL